MCKCETHKSICNNLMVLTFMTVKDEKFKVPARNITCFKLWALIRDLR